MSDEGPDRQEQRDAESMAALTAGGLPVSAETRLAEQRSGSGAWAADLSPAELAAVRQAGFEPCGLVMGSSVYQVGAQWGPSGYAGYMQSGSVWGGGSMLQGRAGGGFQEVYRCPHGPHPDIRLGVNWEHTVYEKGVLEARDLAMGRLVAEAKELGAHGVVGVRLSLNRHQGVGQLVDFTAVGTAIVRPGAPPLQSPFTSDLSGQDFAKLMAGGWVPAGLVLGLAAIEVDPGCDTAFRLRSWANNEIPQLTDGVQRCRELALDHLEREASEVGGEAVVGVDVQFHRRELGGEASLLELLAIGTAVRRFADEPPGQPPLVIVPVAQR